jgi:molybdopterin biosynthesis enzyme
MGTKHELYETLDRIQELTYPPSTLVLDPAKALGYRLAKPVIARGNQPSRPMALADGLALALAGLSADAGEGEGEDAETAASYEEAPDSDAPLQWKRKEPAAAKPLAFTPADDGEAWRVQLRSAPQSNRKEDALGPGQAIAVRVGGEVPRGGETVYPFSALVPPEGLEELEQVPVPQGAPPAPTPAPVEGEENGEEDGDLPVAEPPRDWDMPARYSGGQAELAPLELKRNAAMVPIGGWARNRDVLVQERCVLRGTEVALLQALGVEEVEVYRRPVVGVASLAPLFPRAQRSPKEQADPTACPLTSTVLNIMRNANVAALPLGFAPQGFRALKKSVERWVQQVDILVLVGGSHLGPRCLGLDVLAAIGEVHTSGLSIEPGGSLSAGLVKGWPVIVAPGGLPEAVIAAVLAVRPLAHKYVTPLHFTGVLDLRLEHGSELGGPVTRAVPVRFGWDEEGSCYSSRFGGRLREPWLDFIHGQALVLLEGGREYADGESVTAHLY